MFGLGGTEIVIILVIALLLFGAKNLPQLGKSLGQGIREFKSGVSEVKTDIEKSLEDDPKKPESKA
jgi:sec-independent protein translocase protein TatA